jgi:hypothetical protein
MHVAQQSLDGFAALAVDNTVVTGPLIAMWVKQQGPEPARQATPATEERDVGSGGITQDVPLMTTGMMLPCLPQSTHQLSSMPIGSAPLSQCCCC